MLKKTLIGIGILVGIVVLGAIALVLFVDVDRYKPEIEQYVKDNYNRTLKIDGRLSLSVFPRLALALPKTTLSSQAGDRTAASLDSAKVSVALIPLMRKQVVVDTVRIDGLKATIERRRDGSTNLDDLIKGKDEAAQKRDPAAKANEATEAGGPPQFEIGGIELSNSELIFTDLAAGSTTTLAQLNLKTGRLATQSRTPVSLSTQLTTTKPVGQVDIKLSGEVAIDLVKNVFGVGGLDASVKGTLDKQTIDASAKAASVAFDVASKSVSASKLDVKAKGVFGTVTLDDSRVQAPALAFDPVRKVLSVGGLDISAKGKSGGDAFEATLTAPKLELNESNASGDRVQLAAKLTPADAKAFAGDVRLTLEGMSGNTKQLAIAKMAINASARHGARTIVAALTTPISASFDGQSVSLTRVAGDITVEDPALPQKILKLATSGIASYDGKKEVADLRFSTRFDDTTLSSEVGIRGFSPLAIAIDASADKLDVDRYIAPPPPRPGNDSADPRDDPKVDLSGLKGLNVNAEAKVGELKARGIRASNVNIVARIANGRLDVAPLSAGLYGGRVQSTAAAVADGNRISLDANLFDVSLGPLLKDALDKDILEGRGNVKLAVTTAGGTVGALKKAMNGNGSLALRDGAIKGVNIAQKLRDAKSMLSGGREETHRANANEKTDFSAMTATFAIKNGIATSTDLDAKSPLLRLTGGGSVNLAEGTLDYTSKVAVVESLKGQDGRAVSDLRGITVPVRLQGPFEKMSYTIDWGSVVADAAKSKIAEKVTPQLKEQEKRARDKLEDKLKGLLKR